ncbi:uncharacterized protein LOC129949413 [Eupeodes corollae]|uniref:uncharacterized protein LOC129949413 n=1 Tax=Eupeodes corollae TaxID=290404 RepID=UPI002492D687|nr:uncharacterized protein LOC129949413 [Eupeodes corollae]
MRDKLSYSQCCVTILMSLEILVGLILLCVTTYFHYVFKTYIPKSERQFLFSQITSIYILDFEIFVCFFLGLALWHQCCKNDTITHHSKLLLLWKSFSSMVVVCGSVTIWFQYNNIESLQIAYASSLFQGIDLYFTEPEWKILWDEIQIRNECCGVLGFKDWQEAVWISQQDDCPQMSDSFLPMAVIPYACCKRSATSCFESFAPNSHATDIEDLDKDTCISDINTGGCLAKFKSLTLQFSHILSGIWIFCVVIEMVLLTFILCTIFRAKKNECNASFKDNSDERPLVVLKYSRNVRCITLTDEETFGDDEDEEKPFNQRCSNCLKEVTSIRQDVLRNCSSGQNIFVH